MRRKCHAGRDWAGRGSLEPKGCNPHVPLLALLRWPRPLLLVQPAHLCPSLLTSQAAIEIHFFLFCFSGPSLSLFKSHYSAIISHILQHVATRGDAQSPFPPLHPVSELVSHPRVLLLLQHETEQSHTSDALLLLLQMICPYLPGKSPRTAHRAAQICNGWLPPPSAGTCSAGQQTQPRSLQAGFHY